MMEHETTEQLLVEVARMRDWLSHPEEHFLPYHRSLGISDAVAEETLILLELRRRDAATHAVDEESTA